MHQTTADARQVRPSLLWLLLAPVALVAGVGAAAALVLVTIGDVLDHALEFTPERDLPVGEVAVWVDVADRPERLRVVGQGGAEAALAVDPSPRTVTADGVRWTSSHSAMIEAPGTYRVEATGGRAALRGSSSLETGAVRRNVLTWPLVLATTGFSVCVLVCIAVPMLRAVNRRRALDSHRAWEG